MKKGLILALALFALFTSCRMEKRLYTGGYYISSARKDKATTPPAETVKTREEKVKSASAATNSDVPLITASAEKQSPDIVSVVIPVIGETLSQNSSNGEETTTATPNQARRSQGEKKSRYFLVASVLTFIASLFFGYFLVAGVPAVAYTIFIFTIFGIIGLWIYGLILKQEIAQEGDSGVQDKKDRESQYYSQTQAMRLAQFLGIFGAHRFYLGYFWMGILELFTLGGFFILAISDYFRIKSSKLRPKEGVYDNSWQKVAKKNKMETAADKLLRYGLWVSVLAALVLFAFVIFL